MDNPTRYSAQHYAAVLAAAVEGDPIEPSGASRPHSPLTASEAEDGSQDPQGVDRPSSEVLDAAISADPVVQAIRGGEDLVGRLRACQEVIAIQAALLRWLELHPSSVVDLLETGRAISRRVRAVRQLVELELRQQQHASTEQVDLSSAAVKQVLALLVLEIEDLTTEMLPTDTAAEVIALFRNKVAANSDIPWP